MHIGSKTFVAQKVMSVLIPKADIKVPDGHVCVGPLANISPYPIISFITWLRGDPKISEAGAGSQVDGLKLRTHLSL
jgi:hypothetical protein